MGERDEVRWITLDPEGVPLVHDMFWATGIIYFSQTPELRIKNKQPYMK